MASKKPPAPPPVLEQERGSLEVADRVFRDLVTRVARDVGGIAVIGRVASGLFRRNAPADTVQVERGQGEVALSVSLTVRYDISIPRVVEELRRGVTSAVEEATGYKVRAINVAVEHILPPEEEGGEQIQPQGNAIPGPPPIPDQE